MLVNSDLAKEWLGRNIKNRPLKKHKIRDYSEDMKNGKWSLNGETIKFSPDHTLIDGQNRLYAVINANVPVFLSIAFDVEDPDAFHTIDIGANRSTTDLANLQNIKNPDISTAVARMLLHWDNSQYKSNYNFGSEQFRNIKKIDVVNYATAHEEEFQNMYKEVKQCLPYRKCKAGSSLIASLIICNRKDDVTTMLFVEGLKSGANLPDNSPITLLRDKLISPTERGRRWKLELMAITIKAWNKFQKGQSIKVLRCRQDGDAPEKFPIPGEA